MSEEIAQAITQVAEKLGLAVQEVYQITVQAQKWVFFSHSASILTGVAVFASSILYAWRKQKRWDESDEHRTDDDYVAMWIVSVLCGIIGAFVLGDLVAQGMLRLGAPEYMAMKEMLGMAGVR